MPSRPGLALGSRQQHARSRLRRPRSAGWPQTPRISGQRRHRPRPASIFFFAVGGASAALLKSEPRPRIRMPAGTTPRRAVLRGRGSSCFDRWRDSRAPRPSGSRHSVRAEEPAIRQPAPCRHHGSGGAGQHFKREIGRFAAAREPSGRGRDARAAADAAKRDTRDGCGGFPARAGIPRTVPLAPAAVPDVGNARRARGHAAQHS